MFIVGANLVAWAFFGSELGWIVNNNNFTGSITDAVTYLWSFVQILFGAMLYALPSQAGVPSIISIIILVPYYGALIYIIAPIIERIGNLIINGLSAVIPF